MKNVNGDKQEFKHMVDLLMNELMNEWLNYWMIEWMYEWINEWLVSECKIYRDLHLAIDMLWLYFLFANISE